MAPAAKPRRAGRRGGSESSHQGAKAGATELVQVLADHLHADEEQTQAKSKLRQLVHDQDREGEMAGRVGAIIGDFQPSTCKSLLAVACLRRSTVESRAPSEPRKSSDDKELFTQRRFAAQDVVVVLGEAMGLVAHVLQQPQGVGMPAETQRLVAVGQVNLLFALGKRDHVGGAMSSSWNADSAAFSWPRPPSISSRSGKTSPSSSSRLNRRATTSWMLAKSSIPATPRILYRL